MWHSCNETCVKGRSFAPADVSVAAEGVPVPARPHVVGEEVLVRCGHTQSRECRSRGSVFQDETQSNRAMAGATRASPVTVGPFHVNVDVMLVGFPRALSS